MKSLLALSAAGLLASAFVAPIASARDIDCKMHFNLKSWSLFYKTAHGSGTIVCDNGERMNVKLSAKGGGLTVGKSKIEDGIGTFSDVESIKQTLGTYGSADAHAGAVKSAGAVAMTKGNVSLALSGTGQGWDLGVAFSGFTISRR
ncbi:MAG: hypothetical protein ABIQ97_00810 [Lysobacteraceae bacterium]